MIAIDMTMKRIVCFALAILLLCALTMFTACGDNDENDIESIFERLTLNNTDIGTERFAEHIYIVIPRSSSGELSLKAKELSEMIAEKTGIITTVKYDNEFSSAPAKSCEVLIGNTDRLASDNAMAVLKNDDYLCRWDNGAVVICGRNDKSTIVAIDRFIEEILHGASQYSLMMPEAHFESISEYDISKITLNGYDLYDYTIVYSDKELSFEKEIAFYVRDMINAKSGYLLNVLAESKLSAESGKAIKFLTDENTSAIETKGGNIIISGKDSYSLSYAASNFVSKIYENDANENVELDFREKKIFEAEAEYFSFSIYYLDFVKGGDAYAMVDLIQKLKILSEDLMLVVNPDENIIERIKLGMLSNQRMETFEIAQGKVAIVYNSQTVNSLKCETKDEKVLLISADSKTGVVDLYYVAELSKENELFSSTENGIIFAENCDISVDQGSSVNDTAIVNGEKMNYSFIVGGKYNDEDSAAAKQTDTAFDFTVKIRLNFHPDFYELKNTLN